MSNERSDMVARLDRCVITRNIDTMEIVAPGGRMLVTCQSVAALEVGPEVVLTYYNIGPEKMPNPMRLGSIALTGRLQWRDCLSHVEIDIGPCRVKLLPAKVEYPIVLRPGEGDQGRLLARQKMSMAALRRVLMQTTDPVMIEILDRAHREMTEIVGRMDHRRIGS